MVISRHRTGASLLILYFIHFNASPTFFAASQTDGKICDLSEWHSVCSQRYSMELRPRVFLLLNSGIFPSQLIDFFSRLLAEPKITLYPANYSQDIAGYFASATWKFMSRTRCPVPLHYSQINCLLCLSANRYSSNF